MRRLAFHLLIGLATFSASLVVVSVLNASRHTITPAKVFRAETTVPNVGGPAAQLSSPPPPPKVIFGYDPTEFNPRGDYYILGRKPKNLREFDCLELGVDSDRASGDIMVQTYTHHTYVAHYVSSGLVTGRRLTFVTAPNSEDDFEYSFEGYFTRGGMLSDAGKNEVVLKGRLSKSKRGVKVAEGEVTFRVEYLGC